MTKNSKLYYLFISLIFLIITDLYLSAYIINNIEALNGNILFNFYFIQNTGAAFNIFQDARIFLILFAIFSLLLIVYNSIKYIDKIQTITLFFISLLISGIFCNLYERISLGYVRDFIKLNFINFPIFNISDIFINISVLAIMVIIIKNEINSRRNK